MSKQISVRLDPTTEKEIEEIKNYFKGYGPYVYSKISTGQIIRASIHSFWSITVKRQKDL